MLDSNFNLHKYGLKVRLVNEGDAEFIVKLRSDPDRTKFMLTLDNDVQKQKEWIREYKGREKQGLDYFFLFKDNNDNKVSVIRISKINYNEFFCKASGWIKNPNTKINSMAIFLLHKEIIFDFLKMNYFYSDIHRENSKALKFYNEFNFTNCVENNEFLHFMISRNDFHNNVERVKREYNIIA